MTNDLDDDLPCTDQLLPRVKRSGQNDTKETDVCTLSSHVGEEHTSESMGLSRSLP